MATPTNWIDSPLKWQTIRIFSDRGRPLEIFIENKTKYVLKLEEDFLDTGERVRTIFKDSIDPETSWLTLVANKSATIHLSVGGGLKYRLLEKNCFLYIGFRNPFIGSHMSSVCVTNVEHTAKWAFDEAKDGTFKSSSFGEFRAAVEIIDAIYCPSKRIVFRVE